MNVSFKNPICLANLYYRGGISQLYLQCKVESTHCFNLIASSELVRGFWLPCCHLKLIYAFKKKFRRKKVTILCMSVDFDPSIQTRDCRLNRPTVWWLCNSVLLRRLSTKLLVVLFSLSFPFAPNKRFQNEDVFKGLS